MVVYLHRTTVVYKVTYRMHVSVLHCMAYHLAAAAAAAAAAGDYFV